MRHDLPCHLTYLFNVVTEMRFTTVASAGCGALAWWLEQERPSTPEQFAYWLQQLIYDISVSTLKPKK